jgi:hypothetical protein
MLHQKALLITLKSPMIGSKLPVLMLSMTGSSGGNKTFHLHLDNLSKTKNELTKKTTAIQARG